MKPIGIFSVIPSFVAAGEEFCVKVKMLGPVREIPPAGNWNDWKPKLSSCFNVNVCRQIKFVDNCLPEWSGQLTVEAGPDLSGPKKLIFDGKNQGVFPGDRRPIKVFPGFCWKKPGFHFLRLVEPSSGVEAWAERSPSPLLST
ncbi:MAG TPA: hypothetical protein PKX93_02160 [bacterium]|nr:hypothetical protein [bacterium]HOL66247.1 hypothetical protein [bacterium]HPP12645.1 hypothetical protein [bacterium]